MSGAAIAGLTLGSGWAEAGLAWLHLLAVLSWAVFLASSSALARPEWLNAAALQRLQRVLGIAGVAGGVTLASGLLRLALGVKGAAWYAGQPLLWLKLALVLWMLQQGGAALAQARRWGTAEAAGQGLPPAEAVHALRRQVMRAAHLMLWLPLAGVLLSRGLLVR